MTFNLSKNNIQFRSDNSTTATKVLILSREGIWANPDIPVDEAAKIVLAAIDDNIKTMVDNAVKAEREACAKMCEVNHQTPTRNMDSFECAAAIRSRGNP